MGQGGGSVSLSKWCVSLGMGEGVLTPIIAALEESQQGVSN